MHRAHSRQFTTQFGSFITVHVVEQWGRGRTWGKGDLGHGEGYGAGMEGPEAPWRIPEGGPGVGEARRPDGEYEGGGLMGRRQIARKVKDFFAKNKVLGAKTIEDFGGRTIIILRATGGRNGE